MVSSSAKLGMGRVCFVGQCVWWEVMVMIVMVMISLGKCSGDDAPARAEDCIVYHLDKLSKTPDASFKDSLIVSFLPEKSSEALEGISLLFMTKGNNITIKFKDSKKPKCFSDDKIEIVAKQINTPTISEYPFKWVNVSISLMNGTISIGNEVDVCPGYILPSGHTSLRVIASDHPTNVVFNCQKGCPIYTNSTLVNYKYSDYLARRQLYVKKRKNTASAEMIVQCCLSNQQTSCVPVEIIRVSSSRLPTTWEKVSLNLFHHPTAKYTRYVELNIGDVTIWTNVTTSKVQPLTSLKLKESVGLIWTVDCKSLSSIASTPKTPGGGKTSTAKPTEGLQRTPEPNNQGNNEDIWKSRSIASLIVIIILLLVFVVFYIKNKKPYVHDVLVQTVDMSVTSQIPMMGIPLNNQSEDPDNEYDDPNDIIIQSALRRGQSSNNAESIIDHTSAPFPSDKGHPSSEGDDADDNDYCYIDHEALMVQLRMDKEEKERKKMRGKASGNGDGLSRHEEFKRGEIGK